MFVNRIFPILFSVVIVSSVTMNAQSEKINNKSFAVDSLQKSDGKRMAVRVNVTSKDEFSVWAESLGTEFLFKSRLNDNEFLFEIYLNNFEIMLLSKQSWVKFIDLSHFNRKPHVESTFRNNNLNLNGIKAIHGSYPSLKGDSIIISIKEQPFDFYDIDLIQRVIIPKEDIVTATSNHATEIATIIAGAGNSSLNSLGVSWGSSLIYSNFENLLSDDNEDILENAITVQNHSYGVDMENFYGSESYSYDLQANNLIKIIHVFSAGNKGENTPSNGKYRGIPKVSNLTGQFKVSKNSICVGVADASGRVMDISSSGPTEDGRIKPEVIAYAENGTSEASAVVSGLAALLQQSYLDKFGKLPVSSLIKSAIINSASTPNGSPNFKAGFGSINGNRSLKTIIDENFFEAQLADGSNNTHYIDIPNGTLRLNVTMVWNDPANKIGDSNILTNNINMFLERVDSEKRWFPWVLNSHPAYDSIVSPAVRGLDSLNNVEKVSLDYPQPGRYSLKVDAPLKLVNGIQNYSIVYEFVKHSEWISPAKNNTIKGGGNELISWSSSRPTMETAVLSWKEESNVDSQWQIISNSVKLESGSYEWTTPAINSEVRIRLAYNSHEMISEPFFVSTLEDFEIEYFCDGESMISWNKPEGVEEFAIYKLEGKYMTLVDMTNRSNYTFEVPPEGQELVAIAPISNNEIMGRSKSLFLDNSSSCYFESFELKSIISDKGALVVTLSSIFGVENLFMERSSNSEFEKIYEIDSPTDLVYEYEDSLQKKGQVEYRAGIKTANGNIFYSAIVRFLSVKKKEAIIYPVPTIAGNDLSIAISDNKMVSLQLFDIHGTLISSDTQNSILRKISTNGLSSGIYVLKIIGVNYEIKKKIIIK